MHDWSKRKRLEATISGVRPDRPPVALWRHWPGDDQDAEALAAAHLKWQRDYDWDLLKVSPASSFAIADWGAVDSWKGSMEGTREYGARAITNSAEWETLSQLDPGQGMLATQIQTLHLIGRQLNQETPFIATIFSPLAQAKNLAGNERLLSHMRRNPQQLKRGLETITSSALAYIAAAKKSGIDGIFYAIQHNRYTFMSEEEYRIFGRPYDQRILAAVSDLWLNMIHIHQTDIMFDLVADYPAQFVNWHDQESDISLTHGLERISGAASGGVSRWSLHQDSPRQALAEAHAALAQSDGRRLMLGAGCVMFITTPTRNIRALRQAVHAG